MKEYIPLIIPVLGISAGIIIPIAVFIWQYYDEKGKRSAVIEIAQHLGDSSRVDELLHLFDERKKAPIDYRRGGVITIFVGIGIFLLGFVAMGSLVQGGTRRSSFFLILIGSTSNGMSDASPNKTGGGCPPSKMKSRRFHRHLDVGSSFSERQWPSLGFSFCLTK